ncbi:MAG: cysteine dioxygenase family protein [Bacteroidota bacterium]|nr:cysteine dioxygenase family protein [Bacteroidota bacterium]
MHLNITEEELTGFSNFNHCPSESYGRQELYKADNYGIYVMSWNPGDFTAIHSHGHSEWGAVYFLGNAEHRVYRAEGNTLKLMIAEIIKKKSIAPVCGQMVHAMGNLSDRSFLTLHIYGSNTYKGAITEDSIIYEPDKNRRRTTVGPAFLNISDRFCKHDQAGIVNDEATRQDFKNFSKAFFSRNNIELAF